MLIKFFRSSFIIQYFALVLVTAVLWIPGFVNNPGLPASPALITPFYNIAHYLLNMLEIASPVAGVIIVVISAMTLNNILIFHELTPKNNLLPAFLFILLMSSNPATLCSYPFLIALPLFTWFLHTIYKINDEPENYMEVFNASMLVAVISMIYPIAVILFIFIWMTLLIYGTFNGRNLIISIIALALPYIYLFLYFFWTDRIDEAMAAYLVWMKDIFIFTMNRNILQLAIWSIFTIFMLFPSFTRITGTLSTYGINFRKKIAATAWLLAFALPMIISGGKVDYHMMLFLPAVIMLAHYYHLFKKSFWNEIILLLFVLLILANNYYHAFTVVAVAD